MDKQKQWVYIPAAFLVSANTLLHLQYLRGELRNGLLFALPHFLQLPLELSAPPSLPDQLGLLPLTHLTTLSYLSSYN